VLISNLVLVYLREVVLWLVAAARGGASRGALVVAVAVSCPKDELALNRTDATKKEIFLVFVI